MLQINFNILAGIGRIKDRVKIISIALVFNFIMNLILIQVLWVYWAALATWMGWILIWILSEIFLRKNYLVAFDSIFLLKNIILLWGTWTILYYNIEELFGWLSRLNSFILLCIIWSCWFLFFALINMKEFKVLIWEVKNLKR